jgi:hypothetical protein
MSGMLPFDTPPMVSYYLSIDTFRLSRTIFELFRGGLLFFIPDKPYQPLDAEYPLQDTRKRTKNGQPKYRHFNTDWFNRYPWLHWDDGKKRLFCFFCSKAKRLGLFIPHIKDMESTFVVTGYGCDWKNALAAFKTHEGVCHEEAVSACAALSQEGIDALINKQTKDAQLQASVALTAIITSVKYLGRQGLPMRGHTDESGNFNQLLRLRSEDSDELRKFLRRPKSFTSHEIQDEILELLSHAVLRDIVKDINNSPYFSIIVDETTDCSKKEQVSICMRYVSDLRPVEDFIGLYETANTTGEALASVIHDVLIRLNLPVESLRGQCYDGAANMAGHHKGVQSRILAIQPKALYVHCFAHSLNLSVQESIRSVPIFRDTLQLLHDLAIVTNGSSKRVQAFHDIANGVQMWNTKLPKPLCPTRWTVRFVAIDAALKSYPILVPFLSEVAAMSTVDDSSKKAHGLLAQFENGRTYMALHMMHDVFDAVDTLSCVLQSADRTVAGGLEAVRLTVNQLRKLRTEEQFDVIWSHIQNIIIEYELHEIQLPRHIQRPARYEDNSTSETHCFKSAKDFYRVQYLTFLDSVINHIAQRFEQRGILMYLKMENLLMAALKKEDFSLLLDDIVEFYDDFHKSRLERQLKMIPDVCPGAHSVADVVAQLRCKSSDLRSLFDEVEKLLKFLLVVPASSATAERSFSALRRLKTYLRAMMRQDRLNYVTVLNVHQDRLDQVGLQQLKADFVFSNDYRRTVFGSVKRDH